MKLKKTNQIVIISLAILSILLPYGFISGTKLSFENETILFLFFLLICIVTPLSLWYFSLTHFKELKIKNKSLHVKNIITRKTKQIDFNANVELKNLDQPNKFLIIISNEYKLKINRELYLKNEQFITELKTLANNA